MLRCVSIYLPGCACAFVACTGNFYVNTSMKSELADTVIYMRGIRILRVDEYHQDKSRQSIFKEN